MNFLQIAQEVSQIVGLQGTIQSVSTVTGYQAVVVKYVQNAYHDIQSYRDEWKYLRTSTDISLVQGDTSAAPQSDLSKWDMRHIYYDSKPLRVVSYDYYIQSEQSSSSQGEPSLVALEPTTRYLYFNPSDSSYTVTAYYWTTPEALSANTDEPSIPAEFHKLIVYRATADFASFIGNGNLYQTYNAKANTLMGKLLRLHNPAKRIRSYPAC